MVFLQQLRGPTYRMLSNFANFPTWYWKPHPSINKPFRTTLKPYNPIITQLVGCKGGSRYFEGVCGFLEIPKIQKNGRPKNTKIPRGSESTWKSHRFTNLIIQKYQGSTRIQNHLEILKIQTDDRPKMQRFHADPKLWKMVKTFWETCLT